jgi:transketolase
MPTRKELANSIRALAMDAVQKANSGHPGMPMGMADIAEVLWNDFLRHHPKNPNFINRDRFILSNGHGSMLQYALLYLTGYDLTLDDLKNFRQLHSKTPGHPEYGITPGVETTTGPLGQGLAHAVGMALAEKLLAAEFNREKFNIIDHYTYVILGDGCLMEGISHEACSLAGTWKLNKMIAFYDDNNISIDGEVKNWFTDNTPERFRAYHWHVIENIDGHAPEQIRQAIIQAKQLKDKPVLICCKTIIGFGSPHKAGTCDAHGAPLGEEEVKLSKQNLNWPYDPFEIPQDILSTWRENAEHKGSKLEADWQKLFQQYQSSHPDLAQELLRRLDGKMPENYEKNIQEILAQYSDNTEPLATRKASQNCINSFSAFLPEMLGGSADLTHSNLTLTKNSQQYIYYGVREFGMSAIMCGIALHGGYIPFGGTFLTFCDYARNAVRLAALMRLQTIFVYTHDSIGLGEDGPTHQPIEHITMLRATPNLHVWRPCDLMETFVAWQLALETKDYPSCLLFSRQNLPAQDHAKNHNKYEEIKKGAYILYQTDFEKNPDIILMATGSEVSLAMSSVKILEEQHEKNVRVVSMPCVELFLCQDKAYQNKILPPDIKNKIAIEAGATLSWYRFVGPEGKVLGIDTFGESAPAKEVYSAVEMTTEHVVKLAI